MLDLGEIVTLDNNKEFMCFERVQLDGKDFLYLIAADDSGEICFAEQAMIDGEPQIRTIGNKEDKNRLTALFQELHKDATVD